MIDIFQAAMGIHTSAIGAIATKLIDELETLNDSSAKVYRTFVPQTGSNTPFELLTTSKDIHLAIGRLSKFGQEALARVIITVFDESDDIKTGLLSIHREKGSILVSLTYSKDILTIHLSPAH